MAVRTFEWRDLPILLRYRHHGLFLDNASLLTRGPILVPAGAMLSSFAPATGIFTFLHLDDHNQTAPLIGQVAHTSNLPFAQITYLAPDTSLESKALPVLLEAMISYLGERGVFHLLTEVDERSIAFEALRRASFAIYVRQRIWRLSREPAENVNAKSWRTTVDRDLIAVRSLYNNLVPGLVQQVEPPPSGRLRGLVHQQGDELLAYVELKHGPRGIWVQPFIHPDAQGVAALLVDLLEGLPYPRSRPVYLCIRSYQSWLESTLQHLGAQAGPAQAVMVKHLAISKRVALTFALPAIEGGQPEATAPLVRSEFEK